MIEEMISIILPVYNVEKYLHKCLDSILCQVYPFIEVIIVNDGSTDNSGHICDKYAKKDSRIKVIHQSNQGVSVARNVGLAQAQGAYIGFVDPDDWISPHMYQYLYSELVNHRADMAVCGRYIATDKHIYVAKKRWTNEVEEFTSKEAILCVTRQNQINDGPCDKLYKREILSDNPFPVGRFFEDTYIMVDILEKCKKIIYIDFPCYYYYQRKNSTCHTYSAEFLNDRFEAALIKSRKIKKYYPELEEFSNRLLIASDLALYTLLISEMPNTPECNRLTHLIREDLQQYSLRQMFGISRKRWPAVLIMKYLPQQFKYYAALESIVRKLLIRENSISILKYHKISSKDRELLS